MLPMFLCLVLACLNAGEQDRIEVPTEGDEPDSGRSDNA